VWLKDREETTLKRFYLEKGKVACSRQPTMQPSSPSQERRSAGQGVLVIRQSQQTSLAFHPPLCSARPIGLSRPIGRSCFLRFRSIDTRKTCYNRLERAFYFSNWKLSPRARRKDQHETSDDQQQAILTSSRLHGAAALPPTYEEIRCGLACLPVAVDYHLTRAGAAGFISRDRRHAAGLRLIRDALPCRSPDRSARACRRPSSRTWRARRWY